MNPPSDNRDWNSDLSDTDTQPPDEFSPPALPHGEFETERYDEDELQYMQDTVPVDDFIEYGEAFETQVVDFDDEIPLMDLGNETQVVNLAGETQVVEELHCLENICTQVLDERDAEVAIDSDGEGTDKTEALCDTQEIYDDSSVKGGASHSIIPENLLKMGSGEREDGISKAQIDASSDRKRQSGSVCNDFTSIRAASIRAGGLAAREVALKRASGKSRSPISDSSMKELASEHTEISDVRDYLNSGKDINMELGQQGDNEQMKESRNDGRFTVNSSTVRKLFVENTTTESKMPDGGLSNLNKAGDLPQLSGFENGVAGLSYINSQEPGELSQANALDFVDKFLEVNIIEYDEDIDVRRSTGGKSKASSGAKRTQRLAKIVVCGSMDREEGIFDWDDNREDEGGGEFFRKKKDLFFDNGGQKQKSLTQPMKPRCLDSKGCKTIENRRDEKEEHPDTKKILKDAVHSDSWIVSRKTRGSSKSSKPRRNLEEKFHEPSNAVSGDGLLDTGTRKNELDKVDVGPDTQVAAEAMETLCFGMLAPAKDCSDAGKGSKNMKGSQRAEARNRVQTKRRIPPKKACSLNAGAVTRQSKRVKRNCAEGSAEASDSVVWPKNTQKLCNSEPVKAQSKRAKLDGKSCRAENDDGNLGSFHSKIGEKRKQKETSKASDLDETDRHHVTASAAPRERAKFGLPEQQGSFTPVAHRTRRCWEWKQISSAKESNDSREKTNGLVGVSGHRKRCKIDANALETFLAKEKSDHAVELRVEKSIEDELSDPKFSGASGALKIDAADYPKRQRTSRKLPANTLKDKTEYNTRSSRLKTDATGTYMDVNNIVNAKASEGPNKRSDAEVNTSTEGAEATVGVDSSPRDAYKPSASACTTPLNCRTPVNAASPICMGDEYLKLSSRRCLHRSPLTKELCSLLMTGPKPTVKDSRQRRDMALVRVLFSHHLDADIIKQQKKILSRLGAVEASSISDATHFVTDKFVRTRNMLETIALGRPVVTRLWLESCGQASCLIDEKNFILRDAKKEKEFGFSMPVSLAQASQNPLLQGQRVLITPSTKPGKEILVSLVKAVGGLAIERLGRSALKDEKLLDDLLILSCEEDYETCMPFLERGAAVFSSELLLNGIVTQKLEYERHRLFSNHVKRTRSTIWVKKDNNQYLPVTKRK